MKNGLILLLIFLSVISCAFAVPLENLVSISHAARLRSSDSLIIETQQRNNVSVLLPNNSELRQLVTNVRNAINPSMIVEALYLYKKPQRYYTPSVSWDYAQKTGVFNQILALSTLTGIQYFSASRDMMHTFYEFSGVIDGPQSKNPLPDPVFAQPPQTLTLYARQKDLNFGDNIYRYDYFNTLDGVFFIQENVTSLTYGIIPAIGKGNLRSVIAIFDCGDSILIYAVSMARTLSLPGMRDRISSSFSRRAEAVLIWLTGRFDSEVFRQ